MIKARLGLLREQMKKWNLKAYILTNNDSHQSENTPEHYKVRGYFSGFTGSKGTLIVFMEGAALWVDGRFEIQAAKEVAGTGIEVIVTKERILSAYALWLSDKLQAGDHVGFDGRTMPYAEFKWIESLCKPKKIALKPQIDFIDLIWHDRPVIDTAKIIIQPLEYAGETPYEKLNSIQKDMEQQQIDYSIISDLNDIAWLTNLRSRQIPQNPLFYAFFLIGKHESILFTDLNLIDKELNKHLSENRILIQDYHDIESFVKSLKQTATVFCDETKTSVWLVKSLPQEMKLVIHNDIMAMKRAVKIPKQIEHTRNAQLRECVYMYKYLYWLKHKRNRGLLTELSVGKYYQDLRKKDELYYDDCFHMISAFKENGSLMHYDPRISPKALKGASFYLINTGAHYYDGTTDLARSIYFGKIQAVHKRHYTAVLKALVALSSARFVKGTSGHQLDIIARQHIWAEGLDYHCPTGHGIGYMQAIHEGPHNLTAAPNPVPLEVGMLLTIEPGIYIEKVYGFRLENIVCVKALHIVGDEEFYGFETLSYCPFERRLINSDMLTKQEIQWIDAYHTKTYELLKPQMKPEELRMLRQDTLPLHEEM